MTGTLIGFGVLFLIIALYFITYIANKNIDAPEGAIKISKCSTCGSGSCSLSSEERLSAEDTECDDFQIK